MRFFKLTHPRYTTDREEDRRNPVTSTASHRIPGISCPVCGPWSSSSRLRVSLPLQADEFVGVRFLTVADWMSARDRWGNLLGVEPSLIEPGAKLGPPSGNCEASLAEDVVHPTPGEIWVVAQVRDALVGAGLTGVSFANVELGPKCGSYEFSELVVHGRAWRVGSTDENLRLCEMCGRRGFSSPRNLALDEMRWDGSDFMTLDGNPNIVVVTEPAAEVFIANDFTNVVAEPIS
jgi:hypothetical protein